MNRAVWQRSRPALVLLFASAGLAFCAPAGPPPGTAGEIRIGYPSVADFQDLPSLMALDLLMEQGYSVVPTFFAQSELAVEALATGETDVGFGNARAHWAAIQQGAELQTVMEQAANGWSVVSRLEITDCAGLDGQRLAVGSEGSVAKAMTDAWMAEVCPAAAPEILIIPGSDNRAAALLAGQIDATTAEPADVVQLLAEDSDRFHVLVDFASRLPDLLTTGVHVNSEFAAAHPQAVRDLVKAVVEIHRRVAADPDLLITQAIDRLGFDPGDVPAILETHRSIGTWDVDGGLSREAVEYSLGFYIRTGSLGPGLTGDQVADLSYLEAVLEELGRASSSP